MADAAKSELRETWENAAPGWAKWEREFSAGLSGVTDRLIELADIRAQFDFIIGVGAKAV
jgi:hypothetical protein